MVVYKSCSISSIILSYLTHFEAQGRKWDFLALIFKNFLYFLKRKLLIYQEMELFYISGNGNPEKVSDIFSKESFLLYFRNGHPKIFFTFQEELPKPKN